MSHFCINCHRCARGCNLCGSCACRPEDIKRECFGNPDLPKTRAERLQQQIDALTGTRPNDGQPETPRQMTDRVAAERRAADHLTQIEVDLDMPQMPETD